ncbi:MAG TPA: hypothetical protein DC057_14390 [Spirochaetia bacterium]|nr:hypothetical protein [Spirochaetia bacterium]
MDLTTKKEVSFYYYTNWAKQPFKKFLRAWLFWWATDNIDGLWTEFYIRFLGFSIKFREYYKY